VRYYRLAALYDAQAIVSKYSKLEYLHLTKANGKQYKIIHTCVESLFEPTKLHDDTELQLITADILYANFLRTAIRNIREMTLSKTNHWINVELKFRKIQRNCSAEYFHSSSNRQA